jgi:hypothetical protein
VLVLPEIVLEGIFNTILDRKNNEKNQERKWGTHPYDFPLLVANVANFLLSVGKSGWKW